MSADEAALRLECLKLAAAVAPRSADNFVDAVEKTASRFYNHITQPSAEPSGGRTARVDKQSTKPHARK